MVSPVFLRRPIVVVKNPKDVCCASVRTSNYSDNRRTLTPQVSSSLSLVSPFLLILISWFGSIVSNAEPLKKTKNQKITFGFYLGFAGARSRRSVMIWGGYPTSQFDSHSIFFFLDPSINSRVDLVVIEPWESGFGQIFPDLF